MNRPLTPRPGLSTPKALSACTAQQLFDGAADRTLVRLIEQARDKAAVMASSGVAVALQGHLASALALAEQIEAGRR